MGLNLQRLLGLKSVLAQKQDQTKEGKGEEVSIGDSVDSYIGRFRARWYVAYQRCTRRRNPEGHKNFPHVLFPTLG